MKNEFPEIFYNWFLRKNGYSKKDLTDVWVNAYQEMENTLNETSEYNFMGFVFYIYSDADRNLAQHLPLLSYGLGTIEIECYN